MNPQLIASHVAAFIAGAASPLAWRYAPQLAAKGMKKLILWGMSKPAVAKELVAHKADIVATIGAVEQEAATDIPAAPPPAAPQVQANTPGAAAPQIQPAGGPGASPKS